MQFTPKTESQLQEATLWPAGEYDFEIVQATEKNSKAGNPMFELKLQMFNGEKSRFLTDYIVCTMEFKLRHFFESIGRIKDYDSGNVDAGRLQGAAGRLVIKHEPAKDNFPAKMVVKDYCKQAPKQHPNEASTPTSNEPTDTDDVPF
jgi:hypothetical protein